MAADPAEHGDYAFTKSIYNFGYQAVELAGIGGIRGEVEGKIYLPIDRRPAAPGRAASRTSHVLRGFPCKPAALAVLAHPGLDPELRGL